MIFDPKIETREHHWTPKVRFRGFQHLSFPHQNEILEASALLPVQRTTSARIPELPQALVDCNFFLGSAAVGVSPLECTTFEI